ncbi:MAG TPA: hypothetical protein VGC00_10645 [Thermoanaerobaculia bacterium]
MNRHARGLAALALFFLVGGIASLAAGLSLLVPGSFLEPMWRLNPRGREGLAALGGWGVTLMLTVSAACGAAGAGLWRERRWGYRVAVGLLVAHLVGDIVTVALGIEPRAAIGIPIVAVLLAYLGSRGVRARF